jgi:hypothetical protein
MVLQDGTVTMCGADWDAHAPLGNVRDRRLSDIWNGPELRRRRQAHLDARFADAPICGACQDWRLADGRGYVNVLASESVSAIDRSGSPPWLPEREARLPDE